MKFITEEAADAFYEKVEEEVNKNFPVDINNPEEYISLNDEEKEEKRKVLFMEKEEFRRQIIGKLSVNRS